MGYIYSALTYFYCTFDPSATFQYELTRIEGETSYFEDGSMETCTGPSQACCFIDNNIPNPNENPAACEGLKFDNIPSGEGDNEQESIVLNFTFTRSLPIGSVSMGLKAGNTSAVATNLCGPVCDDVIPPRRGIIL